MNANFKIFTFTNNFCNQAALTAFSSVFTVDICGVCFAFDGYMFVYLFMFVFIPKESLHNNIHQLSPYRLFSLYFDLLIFTIFNFNIIYVCSIGSIFTFGLSVILPFRYDSGVNLHSFALRILQPQLTQSLSHRNTLGVDEQLFDNIV